MNTTQADKNLTQAKKQRLLKLSKKRYGASGGKNHEDKRRNAFNSLKN